VGRRHAVVLVLVGLAIVLTTDAARAARAREPRRRSPSMAFGVALGPGAVIHGLGNYTAGNKRTGTILFATELFGAGLYLTNDGRNASSTDNPMALVGATLFVGSWLFDLTSAPDAARRFNERLERRQAVSLQLEPLAPTPQDPLQPTFRFTRRF